MATITRFKDPLKFQPLEYRGLDTLPVFIEDGTPDSYDYFGLTRVPRELTAGRNLISFTGTRNLVPGSEIAIEVLDSNGNTIPVRTYDHIGEGNERVFAIEIGTEVPEGDALISIVGMAKGKVGFDAQRQRDVSQRTPPQYRDIFNLRWQKRLNCYPRRRNTDEIIYFKNPDITVEEIKRPYFQLHYNQDLSDTNNRSLFTLCSTATEGPVNTTANVRYEVAGDKYYIISSEDPDFGGFTQDMVGGTIFIPSPTSPFPSAFNSPTAPPSYNEIEDGDGTGVIDEATQVYTNQGAYNTIISELISPLRVRVNSPHTTFQGFGRANQKEVFHQKFQESDFRLDFAQSPVSRSNPLTSGSNTFHTSYAKVTFNGLTPLVGDVTRVKTFIRNDQTVNDYFLVGDNPVFSPNLLIQSQSLMTRIPAGDFSPFGVSSSLDTYWSASSSPGLGFGQEDLSIFRQLVGNVNNPIPDSLQIGTSIEAHEVGQLDGTNYILVDSKVPILHTKGQYYQVEFKCFGKRVNSNSPKIKIYMYGSAVNDEGDPFGQMIGEITDVAEQELIVEQDPFNEYQTTSLRFSYKADGTEFGYLRFKIEQGLWFLFDVEVKPYYEHGYTPHFFDTIIPTTKGNVGTVDALDFKFEFYNDEHNKAVYTADIPNIEFDNEFTFTATNVFFASASIDTFIGATPVGDDDWVRQGNTTGIPAGLMPSLTSSIYHSGSVGIGPFHDSTVNFPLHIKKISGGGNATIKLESVSSSILHLASDVDGAGLPNQKNAMVIFDHNNATTSSVIGYTDTVNVDPLGSVFDGAPAGSFTMHERHARAMAFGIGGKTSLIISYDGKARSSARSVYIGHDDVSTGPFNPYHFGYELNVSGSVIVSSGSIYYPQAYGPSGGLEGLDPEMLLLNRGGNDRRVATASFSSLISNANFQDDDWHIGSSYISQSRYGTAAGSGKTVFISDFNDVNGAIQSNTHILQLSQSGAGSKIRFQGLNDLNNATNSVLVLNANGDLYLTGSYGVGGSGATGDPQVDSDPGNAQHAVVFSDDNTPSNTAQRLKGCTTFLFNPADATLGSKLTIGGSSVMQGTIVLDSSAGGNVPGSITPGVYFRMASGVKRALSMERNIIVLGNNTHYGTVKITTGGTLGGYINRLTTAEFSSSKVNINTHMSVSGDISSSGVLFIDHISTGSHDTTESYISVTGSISVMGSVTASAQLSASGNIFGNEIRARRIFAANTDSSPVAIGLKDADDNTIAAFVRVGNNTNAHRGRMVLKDNATTQVELTTNGDSYLNGTSAQLGIGITAPSQKLHVKGSDHTAIQVDSSGGTDKNAFIKLTNDAQSFSIKTIGSNNHLYVVNETSTTSPFKITTSAPEDSLVLNTDGAGIGTDSPKAKLDVRGSISSSGNVNHEGEVFQSTERVTFSSYLSFTISGNGTQEGYFQQPGLGINPVTEATMVKIMGYTVPYNGSITAITAQGHIKTNNDSVPNNQSFSCGHMISRFRSGSNGNTGGGAYSSMPGAQGTFTEHLCSVTSSVLKTNEYPGDSGAIGGLHRWLATFPKNRFKVRAGDVIHPRTFHNDLNGSGVTTTWSGQTTHVSIELSYDRSGSYGNFYGPSGGALDFGTQTGDDF